MDRERFLKWAEHELRFFVGSDARLIASGHRRSAWIEPAVELVFEAGTDGSMLVGIQTSDEDRRRLWGETFRRTRRNNPRWPPGPPPESVGAVELTTDDADRRALLHFRWMFLGQNFLIVLPEVSSCLAWLLLSDATHEPHPKEIELPDDPGEPLEVEWDSN